MEVPTLNDFRQAFPEYSGKSDSEVNMGIANAQELHNVTKRGILLAAAHLICLDGIKSNPPSPDGGLGVVKSETSGSQKLDYETNAGGNTQRTWWSTTPYGREFLQLEDRTVRTAFSILVR